MGRLLQGKLAKIVIYDQARVNGGSNYEHLATLGSQASVKYNLQDTECRNYFKFQQNFNQSSNLKFLINFLFF